jgi:parallel beta-helix repeat protein
MKLKGKTMKPTLFFCITFILLCALFTPIQNFSSPLRNGKPSTGENSNADFSSTEASAGGNISPHFKMPIIEAQKRSHESLSRAKIINQLLKDAPTDSASAWNKILAIIHSAKEDRYKRRSELPTTIQVSKNKMKQSALPLGDAAEKAEAPARIRMGTTRVGRSLRAQASRDLESLTESMAVQRTFTVNMNTDEDDADTLDCKCDVDPNKDGDQCTLRAAIQQANACSGFDEIKFAIGSGAQTIKPFWPGLPVVRESVIIDGTTQPGFAGNPIIEINGWLWGLGITAGNSVVRGLVLNKAMSGIQIAEKGGNIIEDNFIGTNIAGTDTTGDTGNFFGISLDSPNNLINGNLISGNSNGIYIIDPLATGNRVQNNNIGTDISGTFSLGNNTGVSIDGAADNLIAHNLVSGNLGNGIDLFDAVNNRIEDNFLGTDANGTAALSNRCGIGIFNATNNTIGGTSSGTGNVISGNFEYGISVFSDSAFGNKIQGNYIGTDVTGNFALSDSTGIAVIEAPNNTIGGIVPGAGNLISGNSLFGIWILDTNAASTATRGNKIQGNLIGTNATGTLKVGNSYGVMTIYTSDITIGGTEPQAGNVISGNDSAGIAILGCERGNKVEGNLIGLDPTGNNVVNNRYGVLITDLYWGYSVGPTMNVVIGGSTPESRNIISGNDSAGIYISGPKTSVNTVNGNYIGTNANGDVPIIYNGSGILVNKGATNNTIGGVTGNVIAAHPRSGIRIEDQQTNGTVVLGNFIGTDATGEITDPDGTPQSGDEFANSESGVRIIDSPNNLIGGTIAGARNIISGNYDGGVQISGENAQHNLVQGNYIGLNVDGKRGLGNFDCGVAIINAPNNTVGGSAPEAGNVISSNQNNAYGVEINDSLATDNLVQWNLIGTDVTGKIGLGNTGGVAISQANNNRILDNTIAHNRGWGVHIQFAKDNKVQGNYIGTDISGTIELGNEAEGVLVVDASNNIIGGTLPKTGNVISGNDSSGIAISGSQAFGNQILGNFIGTDVTGTVALGNAGDGIRLDEQANDNIMGGTDSGARNIIAFNSGAGIRLSDNAETGNAISANSIFTNGGLGIDLNADGVTPNDANDTDIGANNLQNYPVIASFSTSSNKTTITGTLNSRPNSNYRLEFFSNVSPDPSGFGEGEFFIGSTNITTNGNGDANFTASFPGVLPKGSFITATATDADNNTSEFARCFIGANPIITKVIPPAAKHGTTNLELRIKGVNFVPSTVVSFEPSQGIEIIPPSPPDYGYIGSTELSRRINVAAEAPVGERQVHVTNPNGESGGIRPFNLFTVTDRAASDMWVFMTDDPDPVNMGSNLTYAIIVSHNGPDPATGVTLTDNLQAVGKFVSATTSHGSYTVTGNIVTCTIGTLANNDTAKVTITVIASTISGDITNIVKVTNKEIDADTTNSIAREVTTVKPTTSVEEPSPVVPVSFDLEQNYPNPFNPITTICYAIPKPCFVDVKIYNLLGEEIATLVNEEKPAGEYRLLWDASGLPSGLYLYRIQAGDFVQTKKVVLLK